MNKNLLVTKSTALILGRSKSLMGITKKLLEGKNKGLAKTKPSQEATTHKDITLIGGLMWEKETQYWMTWDDANEYAKNLRLGGYDDWRLPTIEELGDVVTLCGGILTNWEHDDHWNIIDKNKADTAYQANYEAKGFASRSSYWSSNTYAGNIDNEWNLSFNFGRQSHFSKSFSHYVRCVRTGQ